MLGDTKEIQNFCKCSQHIHSRDRKKNSLLLMSIFGRVIQYVMKKVEREVKINKKRISADSSGICICHGFIRF